MSDWNGITFGANSDGSVLDHVKIDYGVYGVQAQDASFTLTNSDVAFSYDGVYLTTDYGKSTPAGATIQGNTIRDGQGTGIYALVTNTNVNYVTPQCPVISGNTITGNQGQGIYVGARSITSAKATLCEPTVENNVISGNGSSANQWALEVHADLLSPTLSTNSGSGNFCQAMALSGTIAGDWTWQKSAAFLPILVHDSRSYVGPNPFGDLSGVTVPAGKTLIIQAGAVVKGSARSEGYLNVNGILLAQGTAADPVVFTSAEDDSYGGDTNADGISSTPAPGDWSGISFGADSDGSVLDHVKLDYGSYGVQAYNASFKLTNSIIKNMWGAITVSVDENKSTTTGAVIQDNAILDCGDGIDASVGNRSTLSRTPTAPAITGNTIDQCSGFGLDFQGGSVSGGVALPVTANVSGNQVTNCGSIYDGTIAIKIDSNRLPASVFTNTGSGNTGNALEISGTLTQNATLAKGTTLVPVVFDGGLTVASGVTLTVAPGAVVKSAGPGISVDGQLIAQGTTADRIWFTSFADDSVGGDTNGNGIASSPSQGDWSGFTVTGTVNMQYCTLDYAQAGIANQETGHTSITYSSLKNCDTGITNSTTAPLVHAENDWWGSDSGPSPYGTGSSISWHTEYDSWSRPYAVFDVDADPWTGKQYGWAPNFGMAGWGGYAADPVNVTIGNYTYANQDFSIATRGLPLEVVRSYNSSSGIDSPFGYGWAFSYGLKLSIDEVNDWVLVTREDGRVVRYTKQADASYTAPAGEFDVLTKDAGDSTYALTSKDQTVYNFDASGKLASVVDRNGNTTTLSYDGGGHLAKVTASDGRSLSFTVDGSGHITAVTDPANRTWNYAYNAAGDLISTTDPMSKVTSYTYDSGYRLLTLVDANGHTVVTNTFDSGGRCLTQLDAKGFKTTYAYDIGNKTTDVTDALGNTTTYVYDGDHRIVKTTSPLGSTTTNTYDDQNNKTSVTDPLDDTTVYTYDYRGNQVSTTNPKYDVSTTSYDTENDPVSTMDYNGRVRTYHYDAHGNLTKEIDPAGFQVAHAYDPYGEVTSTTDQLGKTTSFTYDQYGYLATTTQPTGAVTSAVHDILGRALTTTNALGKTTSFTYDSLSRLLSVTDPLGHSATTTYDAVGNKLTVTDANGKTTSYAYDACNDLVKVTDALGHDTTYVYDADHHRTTVTDANGHAATYDYDADGHLTSVTDPLGRTSTTGYDANGNRTSSSDAMGQTTSYSYDSLNRLVAVDKPGGEQVSYQYDANGNKVSMTDPLGMTSYVHDELNRLTGCTTPDGKTVSYTYDGAGRRTAVTYPDDKKVTYAFDDVGGLSKVIDYASRETNYTYNLDGSLQSVTLPNGIVGTRGYDAAGRLTSIHYAKDATAVLNLAYTLDANGNRIALNDSLAGTTSYEYDALNRLTRENAPSRDVRYAYDATGNRTSMTLNGGATTSYAYDAGDQLQSSGTATYSYNDDGSRIGKTVGSDATTYDYTSDNMLAGVTTPNAAAAYTYNGDDQRVAVTQDGTKTSFALDQSVSEETVLQETTGAATATYVYGAGLISRQSGSSILYYLTDALGSVRLVTDGSGTVTGSYTYDAFGNALTNTDSSGNKFGFTGQWADVDGLTFLRARFYDPASGRFLSVDPVAASPQSPQTLNQYAYCADNPVLMTDVSGQWFGWDDLAASTVGLLKGVTEQFVSDVCSHSDLHWQNYVGAAVGGAVGGELTLYAPYWGDVDGNFIKSVVSDGLQGRQVSNGELLEDLVPGDVDFVGRLMLNPTHAYCRRIADKTPHHGPHG
jgi:RHS repeat-associated protein